MTERGRLFLRSLNDKERTILILVCAGHSNVRIAERIRTTEQVVKNYMRGLLQKAGRRSRFELIVFAFGSGTVTCPCQHRSVSLLGVTCNRSEVLQNEGTSTKE
jgi:DNA-binding CsgD family transcriptional regulator